MAKRYESAPKRVASTRRASMATQRPGEGERLRNLGPVSRRWLAAVGIETRTDLEQVGVVNAYNLLRAHGYNVTLNLLWALQGALLGCDWRAVPEALKRDLEARVESSP